MNKTNFIKELSERLNLNEEKCTLINDILEENFFISKKNKNLIITELEEKLEVSFDEANDIYETAVELVKEEVKNSLKHPFGSKD